MTRRTIIIGISILSLCLIGGALLFNLRSDQDNLPSLASEMGKPQTVQSLTEAPSTTPIESIQQPTAEVLSQRVSEYHINVALNEKEGTLTGSETLTWTHPGNENRKRIVFPSIPQCVCLSRNHIYEGIRRQTTG